MDTLFWIRYNPKIKISPTVKKFFNKYLYKIELYAPGGRVIYNEYPIADALENRRQQQRVINVGYWGYKNKDISNADVTLLSSLREIRNTVDTVKIRVEEPNVQIYAETNQELQNIVKKYKDIKPESVVEVFGPESTSAEQALNNNAILRKKEFEYRYKIILKDGTYGQDVKLNVHNYLKNLGADIKLPKASARMLTNGHGFMWGVYFYVNDINLISFIQLISPGMISNYHELITMTDK